MKVAFIEKNAVLAFSYQATSAFSTFKIGHMILYVMFLPVNDCSSQSE